MPQIPSLAAMPAIMGRSGSETTRSPTEQSLSKRLKFAAKPPFSG
jgi:hypothetical protein